MDAAELKYHEEIERYLDGEMSESESIAFEQRLLSDTTLKYEYDVLSTVVKQIEDGRREQIKAMLLKADEELDSETKIYKKEGQRFWHYALAACVCLLIGISLFYAYNYKEKERENLVASYWQKDAGLPVMMGENKTAMFDNAMSDYKIGNYTEAIKLFNQLPPNDTIDYYTGLSLSEIHRDAIPLLKKVANNTQSVFSLKAKYYLLLLQIKNNNKKEARALLAELLAMPAHPYYSLIEKLRKEDYFKD